jgi:glycerate kinase
MRALIAFDKFKDALTARQACDAAARALRGLHPDWQLDLCPLADGGDGFLDVLTLAARGRKINFPVMGPRGGTIEAPVGLVPVGNIPAEALSLLGLAPGSAAAGRGQAGAGREPPTGKSTVAVVEMAAASGLALLPPELRDPWKATSFGTGQLIRAAAEMGAEAVLLGVGGSATHDLGFGALAAMGLEFRTGDGSKLKPPLPAQWADLESIEGGVFPSIPPICIACDVSNPLLGPRGAAAVYAPQKGLAAADFDRLEAATARTAARLCSMEPSPRSVPGFFDWTERGPATPGAGAAGGLAFGLMVAAGARPVPGFAIVSAWLDFDRRLAAADLVITGEGRFDESSSDGKGPGAVVALGRKLGKPVHVFAGSISGTRAGEPGLHGITPPGMPLAEALSNAAANLAACIREALRNERGLR